MNLEEFVTRALETPFRARGRSLSDGWDCWGLVRSAYAELLGVELPSYGDDYLNTKDLAHLRSLVGSHLGDWERTDGPARLGDVALFRIEGQPVHVGLCVDHRRVLHVLEKQGTFIEPFNSMVWKRRLDGVYRYVG